MFEAKAFSQSFKQVQKKKAGDANLQSVKLYEIRKGLDKF